MSIVEQMNNILCLNDKTVNDETTANSQQNFSSSANTPRSIFLTSKEMKSSAKAQDHPTNISNPRKNNEVCHVNTDCDVDIDMNVNKVDDLSSQIPQNLEGKDEDNKQLNPTGSSSNFAFSDSKHKFYENINMSDDAQSVDSEDKKMPAKANVSLKNGEIIDSPQQQQMQQLELIVIDDQTLSSESVVGNVDDNDNNSTSSSSASNSSSTSSSSSVSDKMSSEHYNNSSSSSSSSISESNSTTSSNNSSNTFSSESSSSFSSDDNGSYSNSILEID